MHLHRRPEFCLPVLPDISIVTFLRLLWTVCSPLGAVQQSIAGDCQAA